MWTRLTQRLGMPLTVVLIAGLALIGGSLAADHWEHIVGFAPFLLLAGCLVMHLFMHRHGGGHGHDR